jgi:hypothetical protein
MGESLGGNVTYGFHGIGGTRLQVWRPVAAVALAGNDAVRFAPTTDAPLLVRCSRKPPFAIYFSHMDFEWIAAETSTECP